MESPELAPVPGDHPDPANALALSPLEKLCVVRCFRPDRAYSAVKQFIITVQVFACLRFILLLRLVLNALLLFFFLCP